MIQTHKQINFHKTSYYKKCKQKHVAVILSNQPSLAFLCASSYSHVQFLLYANDLQSATLLPS